MAPCTCLTCTQNLNNADSDDNDRWASFGLMRPDEDPSTPEEVAALREFVEAYRRTSEPERAPSMSAAEAARRLMSLSEDRVPCDGDYDKGDRVARLLWQAGVEMPHHQTAILEVVDAVGAMPRLEATEEQERRVGAEKLERWRGLDEFWCGFWDERYQKLWEQRYPRDRLDGAGSPEFVRANAFMAHRLVMHPPEETRSLELSRAFRNIIYTLELDPWNHAPPDRLPPDEVKSPIPWWTLVSEQYITMLNTNVHALVPLFDIAGDVIYEWTDGRTKIPKFTPGKYPNGSKEYWQTWFACIKANHPKADLWNGDEWVTRTRWAFWRDRLVWVSAQTELMQRTRDEAVMLVQMMKDIENRSGKSASLNATED